MGPSYLRPTCGGGWWFWVISVSSGIFYLFDIEFLRLNILSWEVKVLIFALCIFGRGVRGAIWAGCLMICHVVVWSIWKPHNNILYSNKFMTSKDVKDMRIFLAWKWYHGRSVRNLYAFSVWLENLIRYMS